MVIDYYYGSVCKLFDAIYGYLTGFWWFSLCL
jgi:hypothetical protein